MIKKIFKIVGISLLFGILGLMILGTIANIILAPNQEKAPSQEKKKVEQEILIAINRLNNECPIQIGEYLFLTKTSFEYDTIRYDYEVKYNDNVKKYYSENPDIVKNLTKLRIIINNHKEWNYRWSELLNKYNYVWMFNYKTSDNNSFSFTLNGKEFNNLLKELTTEEALQSYLNATLFLMNENAPIVTDINGNLIEASNKNLKEMMALEKKYQVFESAFLEGNDVVFYHRIPEIEYTISDIKNSSTNPEVIDVLLTDMCSNPTIKEDLTIFALAKCNLILRYYGVKSKKTAEIKIPYLLIRHHTYIPPELLEE